MTTNSMPEGHDFKPPERQHILIIDDDPLVIEILEKMVTCIGYRVTTQDRPVKALNLFRSEPNDFDMLITDFSMPDFDGVELAKKIKTIRPDLPVVLCTGCIEPVADGNPLFDAVIKKPITLKHLSRILQNVMTSRYHERRKNKRFKTLNGASVIPGHNWLKRYPICDISHGGVSMYLPDGDLLKEDHINVAITMPRDGIVLGKIPCLKIRDGELDSRNETGMEKSRKQCVQFGALTQNQKMFLAQFISLYTEFLQ